MFKRYLVSFLTIFSLVFLAACGGTPYTPVAAAVEPIDLTEFAPKVESFVVLLDTSNSMDGDDGSDSERSKIHNAQDLVASFNAAVPALGFQAGIVTFGKGSGSCTGYGVTSNIYGMTAYSGTDFAEALGSIECAGGTTPIAEALDNASRILTPEMLPAAVIIVSDFKWGDPDAVQAAIDSLRAQHGAEVCLHTVQLGDYQKRDELVMSIADTDGCGSSVRAGDIASAASMPGYVAETLMAPIMYEKFGFSAMTLFDFDKAILKPQGKEELRNLGEYIKSQGLSVADIDIVGHTDNIGTEEYNQDLSIRRAAAVKDFIASEGIDAGIIDVGGMGELDPIESNTSDSGRAKNRRVEVHVGTARPAL